MSWRAVKPKVKCLLKCTKICIYLLNEFGTRNSRLMTGSCFGGFSVEFLGPFDPDFLNK